MHLESFFSLSSIFIDLIQGCLSKISRLRNAREEKVLISIRSETFQDRLEEEKNCDIFCLMDFYYRGIKIKCSHEDLMFLKNHFEKF